MSGIISNIYDGIVGSCLSAAENGLVPDFIVRIGIRYLLGLRAKDVNASLEQVVARKLKFVQELKSSPVAVATDEANEQHYEVPTEYYLLCLGKHLKYSCCLFLTPNDTLGEAEANMLSLSCVRADLKDGQNVLELGCGWGSFSLYAAAKYPNSKITGVSNSRTQREFIMAQAQQRGLTNLQIITANMVDFDAPGTYDRIVTVEMLEHMKNYQELFRRVSTWLKPDGKVFMHVFLHKNAPYHFETEGATAGDWMTKYFFTGGTMPSLDLFLYFQDHLKLEGHWYVNGTNYGRTSENWLVNQDRERAKILPIMYKAYGSKEQGWIWFNRWRMFYLAVAELFKYKNGEEWGVGHFVFTKRP